MIYMIYSDIYTRKIETAPSLPIKSDKKALWWMKSSENVYDREKEVWKIYIFEFAKKKIRSLTMEKIFDFENFWENQFKMLREVHEKLFFIKGKHIGLWIFYKKVSCFFFNTWFRNTNQYFTRTTKLWGNISNWPRSGDLFLMTQKWGA